MGLFTVLWTLSPKNTSHLVNTPEFMKPFGAFFMVIVVTPHASITLRLNIMPGTIKSGGIKNSFVLHAANIVIWKEASAIFNQTF